MNAYARTMIADARQGPEPLSRMPDRGAQSGSSRVQPRLRSQAGSMLLEAFIAILIFSMGILAIVGMQASAIKSSADAGYRSEASLLANELIGTMWVSDRTTPDPTRPALTLQTNFQGTAGTGGVGYTSWYSSVQALPLPGAAANPPTVTVDPVSGLVQVTIFWQAPDSVVHNYALIAQIQ